jgi:hypothetical protein
MDIQIYQAFIEAGVPAEKAHMAADAIRNEIDQRYLAHVETLATKQDLAASAGELRLGTVRLEARLQQGITNLETEVHAGFAKCEAKFEKLELKLEKLDLKIDTKIEMLMVHVENQIRASREQNNRWMMGMVIAIAGVLAGIGKLLAA